MRMSPAEPGRACARESPTRLAAAAVTRSVATRPHDNDTSCEAMPPTVGTRVVSGHHRRPLPRLQAPGSRGPLSEQERKERSFRGTAAWGGSLGCGRERKERSFRGTSALDGRGRQGRGAVGGPSGKGWLSTRGAPSWGWRPIPARDPSCPRRSTGRRDTQPYRTLASSARQRMRGRTRVSRQFEGSRSGASSAPHARQRRCSRRRQGFTPDGLAASQPVPAM
jgi:hypothetical protein